jgi:formylglycine-generating enzyme required for sulfatase activity
VTNAQYALFLDDSGYEEPAFWAEASAAGSWRNGRVQRWYWVGEDMRNSWESGPYNYGLPHNLPNHPVVGISWYEALAYQRWLQRRWVAAGWLPAEWTVCFPSEAEWEKAARGGLMVPPQPFIMPISALGSAVSFPVPIVPNPVPDRTFPWGDETNADYCNARETGLGATSVVGAFPEAPGPYGCEDMVGNVWQWTRTLWGKQRPTDVIGDLEWDVLFTYPYEPADGREDLYPDGYWLRVPRGGSYITEARYCRCSFRDVGAPNFRFPWDGLRIAVLPTAVVNRNTSVSAEPGRPSSRAPLVQ